MTKYFIADLHFNHPSVLIGDRKKHFPTIRDWNEGILEAILQRVTKGDTLFILGDMTIEDKKVMSRFRSRMVGDIWLIRGNHDPGHSACKDVFGKTRVRSTHEAKIGPKPGQKLWMSHYPHAFWPSSHRGSMHIYGHMHGQREDYFDALWPERRSMDVGCENIFRKIGQWGPISEFELLDLISPAVRKGHDEVEFYLNFQEKFEEDDEATQTST